MPSAFVEQAVHEHGHRGLGALDVAAEWTLAQRKNPPVAQGKNSPVVPRRKTPQGARPRTSRRQTNSGSSRDGPRREDADDEELAPLPARVPAGPLAALLRKRLEQGSTYEDLAQEVEIPPRRIRSIVNGEQDCVAFETADAIISRVFGADDWEVELADLYGAAT